MALPKQLERIAAFVDQEGDEKAREIEAKTEEEYTICVGQTIQTEQQRLTSEYEKKRKGVEKMQILNKSKAMNRARLDILLLKEEMVENVFTVVRQRVIDNLKNTRSYRTTLLNLILQACLKMMAPKQLVRVRKSDLKLAKSLLDEIVKKYEEMSGEKLIITVDEKMFLQPSVIGGAEVFDRRGFCKIVNTLQFRIYLVRTKLMPYTRNFLLGANQRRKFYD